MNELVALLMVCGLLAVCLSLFGVWALLDAARRRQEIRAKQASAEARLQMMTQATLARLYEVARQSQGRSR